MKLKEKYDFLIILITILYISIQKLVNIISINYIIKAIHSFPIGFLPVCLLKQKIKIEEKKLIINIRNLINMSKEQN